MQKSSNNHDTKKHVLIKVSKKENRKKLNSPETFLIDDHQIDIPIRRQIMHVKEILN